MLKTLTNGPRSVRALQWDGVNVGALALVALLKTLGIQAAAKSKVFVLSRNPDGTPATSETRTIFSVQFEQTMRNVGPGDWAGSESGQPLIIPGDEVGPGKPWVVQP